MKALFVFCGICCFMALANWPMAYYTFLQIMVSLGALAAIYHFLIQKDHWWAIIFGIILFLFNPILPIHLYRKSLWMPLDIIVGLLFYALAFLKKKEIKISKSPAKATPAKIYTRDRIISPKKSNP